MHAFLVMMDEHVIQKILEDRSVFIILRNEFDYCGSVCSVEGLYFIEKKAILEMFRIILTREIHRYGDLEKYHPKNRFEDDTGRLGNKLVRDNWNRYSYICNFSIEEWLPNKSRKKVQYCNLDFWLKMHIIKTGLGRRGILELFKSWKQKVTSNVLPEEFFEMMVDSYTSIQRYPGEKEEWCKKWSLPPNPGDGEDCYDSDSESSIHHEEF